MDQANEYPIKLTIINIAIWVPHFIITQLYLTSLILILMSWISKLTDLNKSTRASDAKKCFEMYSGLETGMGPFFFLWISVAQLMWITMIFLALSMVTDGLSKPLDVADFFIYLAMAMGTMLQATASIFCLSDCHKSLEVLGDSLADDILEMEPGTERQKAEVLLKVGVKTYLDHLISVIRRLRS